MFLTMMILGHLILKHLIDVYLELLMEELQNLWHVGVLTHDNAKNKTFTMPAVMMWTVNDLLAYGMVFGWSTTGVVGCPVCMKDTRVFYLPNDWMACYFDCHRQILPQDHRYRRNKKAFTTNRVERRLHVQD
ncbi:UNVERIFIED_CONTAM: hypothetical protein Sangu_2569800 [Sesamum angustifolium]|uniref:Uncharacterized protein n=1 Tax=Sesamum angustifolium TaxID=2727405 RepID=A0AAW2JAE8_9LAMI